MLYWCGVDISAGILEASLHICWAEKIPLFILFAITLILLFAVTTGGTGLAGLGALIEVLGIVLIKWLLPLWLILRVIDALLGGPSKRRGVFTVHRL